jgi:hypothetical protein
MPDDGPRDPVISENPEDVGSQDRLTVEANDLRTVGELRTVRHRPLHGKGNTLYRSRERSVTRHLFTSGEISGREAR